MLVSVPTPTQFTIWPHERRFRAAAQHTAAALFDALDDELRPYVLLVGLPADPASGLPIGQEAGTGLGLPPEALTEVVAQGLSLPASALTDPAPENATLTSAVLQRRYEHKGIRMAMQRVLDKLAEHTDYQYFTTWPVRINGYYIFTVLQLQRKAIRSYPALRPDRTYTDGRPLANSLLTAAMLRFNEECIKSLTEPEPGAGLLFRPRDTDELLRELQTMAEWLGLQAVDLEGTHLPLS